MKTFFILLIPSLFMGCLDTNDLHGTFDSEANLYPIAAMLIAVKNRIDEEKEFKCGDVVCFAEFAVYDGSSFSASGNDDGLPNRNETIRIDIAIANTGNTDLVDVTGSLSTTSDLATIDEANATKQYGRLLKKDGDRQYYHGTSIHSTSISDSLLAQSADAFLVAIPATIPDGAEIPFVLRITDSLETTWQFSFKMKVIDSSARIDHQDLTYETN